MAKSHSDIGLIGLAVMGQNLALNIDEKGFSCAAWDAWPEPVDKLEAKAKREGAAKGKQFVKQPKEIAKKTAKYRS